jgi:hypothetical protein
MDPPEELFFAPPAVGDAGQWFRPPMGEYTTAPGSHFVQVFADKSSDSFLSIDTRSPPLADSVLGEQHAPIGPWSVTLLPDMGDVRSVYLSAAGIEVYITSFGGSVDPISVAALLGSRTDGLGGWTVGGLPAGFVLLAEDYSEDYVSNSSVFVSDTVVAQYDVLFRSPLSLLPWNNSRRYETISSDFGPGTLFDLGEIDMAVVTLGNGRYLRVVTSKRFGRSPEELLEMLFATGEDEWVEATKLLVPDGCFSLLC